MADTRPTFPLSQRYTLRKQKQFSRPMTGHTPQKLPFFNAISCIIAVRSADFAYTRSIILPFKRQFVNIFFRKNHKYFNVFSALSQNLFSRLHAPFRLPKRRAAALLFNAIYSFSRSCASICTRFQAGILPSGSTAVVGWADFSCPPSLSNCLLSLWICSLR